MLLPSALGCDSSAPKTRSQAHLLASPPLSPPSSSPPRPTIYSTCRALHSMITTSNLLPSPLPSPPTVHAEVPASPFKLRLRTRKDDSAPLSPPRIAKRRAPPPRSINKRRREDDDDMGRDDVDHPSSDEENIAPSTPKRLRFAPEVLPLGLERSDFHTLKLQRIEQGEEVVESSTDDWSTEQDRLLVELVLEKLKLSKTEWEDCARSLGRDRGSVGRRWKSLMAVGDVGLKGRNARRGKINSTWR